MEIWETVVDRDLFARVGARAFRRCEAHDVRKRVTGYGVTREQCGGAAMRGITWQGLEGRHSLLVCDQHTLAYLGPFIADEEDK